jgi:cell shape-determining protein MreD
MGTFTLNTAGLLALLIQFVLPLLVGLVTRTTTSPAVKAVLLLLLSAAAQVLVAWADAVNHAQTLHWQQVLWSALVGFVLAVAAHFGLWKPVGATAVVQGSLVKDPAPRHPVR